MDVQFFAVFVVARAGNGLAATTRAADRGEAGRIGLPGGKVDEGETAVQAAVRESAEEGWLVSLPEDATPAHVAIVDGKPVAWLISQDEAEMLTSYKEAGRITPVVASLQSVADSCYGNEWLVA
jgi:8-oxo-dGTP pyrophosphatase MutT (NUDIX family)